MNLTYASAPSKKKKLILISDLKGRFRHRCAPAEAEYDQEPIEVPVTEPTYLDCGGTLLAEGEQVVTNPELPEMPKPIVKAYRVQMCQCSHYGTGQLHHM